MGQTHTQKFVFGSWYCNECRTNGGINIFNNENADFCLRCKSSKYFIPFDCYYCKIENIDLNLVCATCKNMQPLISSQYRCQKSLKIFLYYKKGLNI